MKTTTTTQVELCPKCRASIALTSYTLPFEDDFTRAYHNPPKTESFSIESSLTDPSAESTTLAEEIQRVESLLKALKTHHVHLERYIHRTTTFIQSSPIRQLPTEVLGVIFAFACTSFQQDEYKTPLSISLVCSKWRDISISTPALWTNIYVAPYSRSCGVPVYDHYLRRCGRIPISIKLEVPARDHPHQDDDDDDFPFEQTYEYHVDVMGDIYVTFDQWKVAEFHMKEADVRLLAEIVDNWLEFDAERFMEKFEPPILILESLTLAIRDGPLTGTLPNILSTAPSLSAVNLLDCSDSSSLWTDARLPWGQLRQVQLDQAKAWLLGDLDDFNNGDEESRILVLNGPHNSIGPPVYRHVHPDLSFILHVTTLIFDSPLWNDDMCAFFRNGSIPTLEDLTLIVPNPIFPDPETCRRQGLPSTRTPWSNPLLLLPGFLQSSRCKLSTFSLVMRGRHGDTYPDSSTRPTLADSLIDALRDMGALKRLQVIEAESGPRLLNKRLFEQLSADALLPELTSLELVWAEDRQPDEELLSTLSSRAEGSLSSVVLGIRNGGKLGWEVLECMRGLRQKNVQATCW